MVFTNEHARARFVLIYYHGLDSTTALLLQTKINTVLIFIFRTKTVYFPISRQRAHFRGRVPLRRPDERALLREDRLGAQQDVPRPQRLRLRALSGQKVRLPCSRLLQGKEQVTIRFMLMFLEWLACSRTFLRSSLQENTVSFEI